MAITKEQVRNCLDKLGVSSRLDNDGDLVTVFNADETFPYNVYITIIVDNNRVSYISGAPDYHPQTDPLFLVNRSNARRNYPTAVVRGGEIRMEYSYYITEEVSEEYLTQTVIRMILSSIWTAYTDLEKDSIE